MNLSFPIPFTKMSGAGNDFILIDHRQPFLTKEEMPAFARAVCERKFSVGADGLILIEGSRGADFSWQFLNGDGSFAEMCGNGARCAARFANTHGIAPARMRFETRAGIIEAEVVEDSIRLKMTDPTAIQLDLGLDMDEGERVVHSVNTGVPHVVVFVENIDETPVQEWGRFIRYHEKFQPAGTNVNFVQHIAEGTLKVRTYERGVEGETMACGTGAVAAAIVSALRGSVKAPVKVITSGNEQLIIHLTASGSSPQTVSAVFLEGPANFIYDGQLHAESLRRKS